MPTLLIIALIICCFMNILIALTCMRYIQDFSFELEDFLKEVPKGTMSSDDMREFAEADAAAVDEFRNALAGLNAFMTGTEEDENHAEQQEF